MKNIGISVIIPHYEDHLNLKNLVKSILNQKSFFSSDEVLIVDDCSKNKPLIKYKKNVKVVALKKNSGPGNARNIGIKKSKNKIIFFLDSDTILRQGSIKEIKKHYSKRNCEPILNGHCSLSPIQSNLFKEFKSIIEYDWYLSSIKDKGNKILNTRVGCIPKKILKKLKAKFNTAVKTADTEDYEFSIKLKQLKVKISKKVIIDHDFPGFFNTSKVYFRRSKSWTNLFMTKKIKFSSGGTSKENMIAYIAGSLTFIFFISEFFLQSNFIFSLLFFFIFVYSLKNLFLLSISKKGFLFTANLLFYQIYLSLIICLGGCIQPLFIIKNKIFD